MTVGRHLQSLAIAKGDPAAALGFVEAQEHWLDRATIAAAHKAAVTAMGTSDFPAGAYVPIANAFLAAMRPFSVPLRLANLRLTPMLTRIFVNTASAVASEVAEGNAIPVLRSSWDATTLTPRKHGVIVVQTEELMRSTSPTAALAITDDLAAATAEAENASFCSPWVAGSVLDGAVNFVSTGNTASAIADDARRLTELVPGSFRPGAAWLAHPSTLAYLGALRVAGNAPPAFPGLGPQGGEFFGLPALPTAAMELAGSPIARALALVSPQEIFWADEGRVILSISNDAALQMDDAATISAATGTPGTLVSMFQTSATATKAVRESAWYARPGAGAYVRIGF